MKVTWPSGGPGRIGLESGLSDVQDTTGKGKLPVTTGGRVSVCKAWRKAGQYKVTLPLAAGFWIWYELPQGREWRKELYSTGKNWEAGTWTAHQAEELAFKRPKVRNWKLGGGVSLSTVSQVLKGAIFNIRTILGVRKHQRWCLENVHCLLKLAFEPASPSCPVS